MKEYSAVIRTLGKSGEYYQRTLDSLISQTVKPSSIIVYIAEGYSLPLETVGTERYVYVKKGMVAQRALQYDEVQTEYILFLDDDVYLPSNGVEKLFSELEEYKGDVIAPNLFDNHIKPFVSKLRLSILGREVCRVFGNRWGFKVLPTGGFSYINNPIKTVYKSQTNAGPCFLCRKEDFLNIKYEDELWLDETPYAFPDDQVMFYKMYLNGIKIFTSYDSGIIHLDAGSSTNNEDRTCKVIYSEYRNKLIFWHRFIYIPEKNIIKKMFYVFVICYAYGIQTFKYSLNAIIGDKEPFKALVGGIKDAISYLRSTDYNKLNVIVKRK